VCSCTEGLGGQGSPRLLEAQLVLSARCRGDPYVQNPVIMAYRAGSVREILGLSSRSKALATSCKSSKSGCSAQSYTHYSEYVLILAQHQCLTTWSLTTLAESARK
jgi:hypothetical protein